MKSIGKVLKAKDIQLLASYGVLDNTTAMELMGDPEVQIDNIADPSESNPASLIFLEQEKFFERVLSSEAGLIITTNTFAARLTGRNLLIVEKPYYTILKLVAIMQAEKLSRLEYTRSEKVHIGKGTILPEKILIQDDVWIGENCQLGNRVIIEAGCVVGDNCRIGDGCHLYPRVVVYEDCVLMERVTLHAGVVIGADGFGYLLMDGKQQKIPQIGNVIIHSDVEIGAGSTIDRGTIGSTVIGEGTKIDNLVQIGHNCVIGKHSILCAQVGLAGSTIVGDYVYLAGQVGVAGHLTIGDGAMVGAQSGVAHDIEPGGKYFGYPAREAGLMKRIMAAEKKLPDIYRAFMKNK